MFKWLASWYQFQHFFLSLGRFRECNSAVLILVFITNITEKTIKDYETDSKEWKQTHFSCPIILVCLSLSATSSAGGGFCWLLKNKEQWQLKSQLVTLHASCEQRPVYSSEHNYYTYCTGLHWVFKPVDLHLTKALFSLNPDNLQLHCFLQLGTLFCCLFFCPLDQPFKTLQTVQVPPFKHCLTQVLNASVRN